MNLGRHIKILNALDYASGTASRNGAEVDMQDWDGVIAVVKLATIAASAVGDIHWEQDTATGMGSAADLTGTAIAIGEDDDDEIYVSELYRPLERFVRIVVTKDASNAQAESAVYILYKGDKLPVADMGADAYELNVSPAEGTK